eukprot:TRINITY_DN25430_c0_g1_i1.p1 TRINITY_DN25430_c0_g1~~TRINITY_DN25430_c0_g1_i1.p1  ORF type:complete len:422 (-),score=115.12 TRINITY_DN25430_c0_g1_i1:289-1554(-)
MSSKKESRLDSLLHSKARSGDVARVKQVLDSGRVDPDCKDQDGTTPLMLAAGNGRVEVVSLLLEEGADPNIRKNTGVTAIFLASVGGYLDIVSTLVKAGADADPQSQEGGTPLMAAAQAGHMDVVEKLLLSGADHNACMWDGANTLFLAGQNGHARIVMHLLAIPGMHVNQQRRDGATPLWIAAQMGHEDCVRLMLRGGADVDLARADGATPLFKACHKGHEEVVKEILRFKPRLDTLQNGSTCLHAAALSGHASLILHLLDAGADPNTTNASGFSPLDVALGAARKTLKSVTSRITDPHLLGGMDCLARSLTPDKLSSLRNGASLMLRPAQAHYRSQSPLASCQVSPVRRLSINKTSRSPSTCPTTPCRMYPKSTLPTALKDSTVQFNDPKLCKNGVLVKKVQCRIVDAKELLSKEKPPD